MGLHKIKWILGVLLVFFLVLATNIIDKNNFNRVKDSMVNLYEDRLLAKGILFDISILINEKEVANYTRDTNFYLTKNNVNNSNLANLFLDFEHTKLTANELGVLKELDGSLEDLKKIENNLFNNVEAVSVSLNKIKGNLVKLSHIQLEEGRRQMFIGKQAIDSVELLTQLEVYCLIFLAVIIQIIIIAGPKKLKK